MTNATSNILPFPMCRAPIQNASQSSNSEAIFPHLQITAKKDVVADDEYREHVACIIGVVIRACRRKGRSLSSLQPQLRKWLTELCDQGDPSAVVVHDWLTGNRRHLPPGFDEEEAKRQLTTRHELDIEEGQ